MSGFTIRPIEREDNAAIEQVIRACLIEFHADHEGTAWADPDLGRFSEIYHTQGTRYWVAVSDKEVIGGVGIGATEDPAVCELQKMYCKKEARGTGVAHRLMETALSYAKRYYSQCYLETLPDMTAAQRFYEKYGFSRTDRSLVKTDHFACDVRYVKNLNEKGV